MDKIQKSNFTHYNQQQQQQQQQETFKLRYLLDVISSSGTLVTTCKTRRCHNPSTLKMRRVILYQDSILFAEVGHSLAATGICFQIIMYRKC
jgi:hypothetical protein